MTIKMNRQVYSDHVDAFLVLLRSGLWTEAPDDMSLFPLSDYSWNSVYELARRHSVTGLVYSGMLRLPDDFMPCRNLLLRWVAEVDAIEKRNRLTDAVLARLASWFSSCSVRAVLVKGQGVAAAYAEPGLRECGDIDFFFPDADGWRVALIELQRRGVVLEHHADGAFSFRMGGVEIELHRSLVDVHAPAACRFAERFVRDKGFVARDIVPASGVKVLMPVPVLDLVMQNAHILKHMLGRGIGLRQYCDIAAAYRAYRGMFAHDEYMYACRCMGLARWTTMLHGFLAGPLGADASLLPSVGGNGVSDRLFERVMLTGNFGRGTSRLSGASGYVRKLNTVRSFLGNACFSLSTAPAEALWTFADLVSGQFKKR